MYGEESRNVSGVETRHKFSNNYFLFHLRASKHADIVYGNILSGVKMCLNSVINA